MTRSCRTIVVVTRGNRHEQGERCDGDERGRTAHDDSGRHGLGGAGRRLRCPVPRGHRHRHAERRGARHRRRHRPRDDRRTLGDQRLRSRLRRVHDPRRTHRRPRRPPPYVPRGPRGVRPLLGPGRSRRRRLGAGRRPLRDRGDRRIHDAGRVQSPDDQLSGGTPARPRPGDLRGDRGRRVHARRRGRRVPDRPRLALGVLRAGAPRHDALARRTGRRPPRPGHGEGSGRVRRGRRDHADVRDGRPDLRRGGSRRGHRPGARRRRVRRGRGARRGVRRRRAAGGEPPAAPRRPARGTAAARAASRACCSSARSSRSSSSSPCTSRTCAGGRPSPRASRSP